MGQLLAPLLERYQALIPQVCAGKDTFHLVDIHHEFLLCFNTPG